jgi:hypothetical protein
MGRHRSFITQMISPTYPTPIPQRHLATLFAVCHFSVLERLHDRLSCGASGQARYRRRRAQDAAPVAAGAGIGRDKSNAALDKAISEFVQRLTELMRRGGDE